MLGAGRGRAQYRKDTPLYIKQVKEQEALLKEQLKSGPEVELTFYPERAYFDPNHYVFSPPTIEDYKIGLILDPCKGREPDCCMNIFGTPEYGLKTAADETYPYRVVPKRDLGDDSEILANVELVNEFRESLPDSYRRRADDMAIVDDACKGNDDPDTSCTGFRKRESPLSLVPACRDNNQTVNATSMCYDPANQTWSWNCVQVGYTQTGFSVICGNQYADDPHCGTFLEVHLPNGSPDYDKTFKISERKITVRNTTGYMTTTIPLHFTANDTKSMYRHDARRLLCAYTETKLRVGSSVLIKDTAPLCCCPNGYTMCPVVMYDTGPTCPTASTLAQKLLVDGNHDEAPYCFPMPPDEDWIMCSKQSWLGRTVYYRCPTTNVTATGGFGSSAINGSLYSSQCPYLPECVSAFVDTNGTYDCRTQEDSFTFRGMVGTVVSVPADTDSAGANADRTYGVSFNNGRSVYYFDVLDLVLDPPNYNYELWWVQRTRYDLVVQKRKPFTVTSPTCTYDPYRQEYLPYALMLQDGTILDKL